MVVVDVGGLAVLFTFAPVDVLPQPATASATAAAPMASVCLPRLTNSSSPSGPQERPVTSPYGHGIRSSGRQQGATRSPLLLLGTDRATSKLRCSSQRIGKSEQTAQAPQIGLGGPGPWRAHVAPRRAAPAMKATKRVMDDWSRNRLAS